jgi:hypothetical protein
MLRDLAMSRSRCARTVVAWSLGLAACLAASGARAQVVGIDTYAPARRVRESPQRFAFEARFGAFSPDIDSDPALAGNEAYASTFGSCPSATSQKGCTVSPQLLAGGEFSWEALRIPGLGTLGPGVGAAYMKATTKAKFVTPQGMQTTSGEDTSLEVIPFYGVAVLRVDVLWRNFGVPLVPWAKLGVGYALWRASNTLGTSTYQSISGTGHSMGTHVALGIGLNLNVFDPYAAKNFDASVGVNNTYLFAEWTREDLNGLGLQSDPMRVGGTEWTFGLALEF